MSSLYTFAMNLISSGAPLIAPMIASSVSDEVISDLSDVFKTSIRSFRNNSSAKQLQLLAEDHWILKLSKDSQKDFNAFTNILKFISAIESSSITSSSSVRNVNNRLRYCVDTASKRINELSKIEDESSYLSPYHVVEYSSLLSLLTYPPIFQILRGLSPQKYRDLTFARAQKLCLEIMDPENFCEHDAWSFPDSALFLLANTSDLYRRYLFNNKLDSATAEEYIAARDKIDDFAFRYSQIEGLRVSPIVKISCATNVLRQEVSRREVMKVPKSASPAFHESLKVLSSASLEFEDSSATYRTTKAVLNLARACVRYGHFEEALRLLSAVEKASLLVNVNEDRNTVHLAQFASKTLFRLRDCGCPWMAERIRKIASHLVSVIQKANPTKDNYPYYDVVEDAVHSLKNLQTHPTRSGYVQSYFSSAADKPASDSVLTAATTLLARVEPSLSRKKKRFQL